MKRLLAAAISATAVLCLSIVAFAQQPGRTPRLGWLQSSGQGTAYYQSFRDALAELGYVDGKNIVIVTRSAEGRFDRLPALAKELVQADVDLLFVGADQGLRAAKQASETVPILFVTCDTIETLVASIARPGGKVTGLTCISSEIAGKRLQLLKDVVPGLARVGVLYNPGDRNKPAEFQKMREAADRLGLILSPFEADTPTGIEKAFAAMDEAHMQALAILSDAFTILQEQKIADLALAHRLPSVFGFREYVDKGGLLSYGTSLHDTYRRAAFFVDRIFKGTDIASLPIEQPTRFELLINLKTAKALGLAIPPSTLALASETVE